MEKVFITCLGVVLLSAMLQGKYEGLAGEKYPLKPISFIVPAEPGSGIDIGGARSTCAVRREIMIDKR